MTRAASGRAVPDLVEVREHADLEQRVGLGRGAERNPIELGDVGDAIARSELLARQPRAPGDVEQDRGNAKRQRDEGRETAPANGTLRRQAFGGTPPQPECIHHEEGQRGKYQAIHLARKRPGREDREEREDVDRVEFGFDRAPQGSRDAARADEAREQESRFPRFGPEDQHRSEPCVDEGGDVRRDDIQRPPRRRAPRRHAPCPIRMRHRRRRRRWAASRTTAATIATATASMIAERVRRARSRVRSQCHPSTMAMAATSATPMVRVRTTAATSRPRAA